MAIPMINNIPMIDTFSIYQQNQIPLADQIIAESLANTPMNFINAPQDYYPTTGIVDSTPARNMISDPSNLFPQIPGFVPSRFEGVSDLGRDDEDVEQVEYLTEPSGIKKLLQYLPFGDKSLLRTGLEGLSRFIPRSDPRTRSMQNFYGSRFGLTPTGSVASGIMAGYNPVSGFGSGKTFGLQKSIADRIAKRSTIGQARIDKRYGKDSKRAKDFAAKTQELINLGKDERGSKSLDKAFDRDRTRAKDLGRMRGGVGR